MSNSDVEFVTVWPEDFAKATVMADSMRLSQILHNLLSNAFKFTEKGEVVLAVRLREGKGFNQVRLEVQVLDTGVGIERNNLDLILMPSRKRTLPSAGSLVARVGIEHRQPTPDRHGQPTPNRKHGGRGVDVWV